MSALRTTMNRSAKRERLRREGWADPVVAAVAGNCGTSVAGMVVVMLWRIVNRTSQ
jgi:hypothetical protein